MIKSVLIALLVSNLMLGGPYKVDISQPNATVKTFTDEFTAQTSIPFSYESKLASYPVGNVSLHGEDTLEALLSTVLSDKGIVFKVVNDMVVLTKEDSSPSDGTRGAGQVPKPGRITVTGTVVDESGQGVIGAVVLEKGNNSNGVTVDMDGNYSIQVPSGAVLSFESLGFVTSEEPVGGRGRIDVVLKENRQLLDEVIVVGYGVQRRSDITGALSSVDVTRAQQVPTTSIAEMLRGSAPGIQVNIGSAAPGGSSTILIRGRHSLSGDNAPLYIVDGVPMSSIDDVNGGDISSIEVLKDAASQSIYGARAANGVVLITTKRGAAGQTRVSYDGYVGVQTILRNFEFFNGEQWAAYRHEAFYNAYGYYDEDDCFRGLMKEVLNSGEYVNWESLMIKPAVQHKHDVLIQAGTDKTKAAVGLGYYDQDGMVSGSGFKRVSGRLNLDQELSRTVSLGSNITYARSWRETADGSFNSFVTMPPLAKVYDESGELLEDVTEAGESHTNPLWNINNSANKTIQNRLLINLFVDWNIVKGLSYRLNTSMSYRGTDARSYLGLKHTTGKNTMGKATVSDSSSYDYLLENILNYTHDFSGGHHFDATLMQSFNVITWKKMGVTATGFANDDLLYNAVGNALVYGQPDWELSRRQIVSFLGRARYNYKDRYLLTLSARVDGSSVFGENNKYGVFPSAAFAWRINKEEFMQDARAWLSNLKLRLSWGQVGNQGISPYTTLGNTEAYYYRFGDEVAVGYLPSSTLYNPNLRWETSSTANIGVDFGFLKDRINGSIELYDTQTTDLLVNRSINQVLGYTTQMMNLGRVQNRGIEIALNTTPVSTRDFSWDIDLAFSRNVNCIKRISGEVDADGKPLNDVNNKWFIGSPVNVYYDYKFDGIWQLDDDIENSVMPTATPGSIKIADTDGDGTITESDRVIMRRDPDWIGNVSMALNYKGIDLSADLNISYGGTFYNSYLTTFGNGGDLTGKRNGIRRNYWTLYNPSNEAPTPNMVQAPAYINALGYQDATYLRLRRVTLGYNFPERIADAIKMRSLRVYLSCNNVWYYTEVLGYGPEQSPGAYPEPRTLMFGVKASF